MITPLISSMLPDTMLASAVSAPSIFRMLRFSLSHFLVYNDVCLRDASLPLSRPAFVLTFPFFDELIFEEGARAEVCSCTEWHWLECRCVGVCC